MGYLLKNVQFKASKLKRDIHKCWQFFISHSLYSDSKISYFYPSKTLWSIIPIPIEKILFFLTKDTFLFLSI